MMITYQQLTTELPWLVNAVPAENSAGLVDWINLQIRNGIAPVQVQSDRHMSTINQIRSTVRTALEEWVNGSTIERDDANNLLDSIDAPRLVMKWKVAIDYVYDTYAIVTADSEEDAIQMAADNMDVESITATVTISLNDDDDVEWNRSSVDLEEIELNEDCYDLSNLDMSAEEED